MNQNKPRDMRVAALGRFAIAISTLNLFGHFYLGFEQSWAQPLVGLATAYVVELLLETLSAWGEGRMARYRGGINNFLSLVLPAHITGLAVPMLLYANDHFWPIIMGVTIGIASKYLFRVRVGNGSRHFFNPSNTGIAATLLLLPWVGIAPPYHFTENISGWMDWALPALIILSGSFLNWRFTRKLPLILSWLVAFAVQATLRSFFTGLPITATLLPMTGVAFILFTFYMVSDPGTTPTETKAQIYFGAAVAITYGLLVTFHGVFGIFFSLFIVCTLRGVLLYVQSLVATPATVSAEQRQPAAVGGAS